MSTAQLIQSRWRRNGNIAIRHLEYRAEKWRSITLDCHSYFHRPLRSGRCGIQGCLLRHELPVWDIRSPVAAHAATARL
jgi:hypothetical protein